MEKLSKQNNAKKQQNKLFISDISRYQPIIAGRAYTIAWNTSTGGCGFGCGTTGPDSCIVFGSCRIVDFFHDRGGT